MTEPAKIPPRLLIFGEGELRFPAIEARNNEQQSSATAGSGLGFEESFSNSYFMVKGSVRKGSQQTVDAKTDGTDERAIGATLLNPQASNLNFLISTLFYTDAFGENFLKCQLGGFAYFSGGGYTWNYYTLAQQSSTDGTPQPIRYSEASMDAQPMGFAIGPSIQWAGKVSGNDFKFFIHLGYAGRVIGGDAAFASNAATRKQLIGTTQTFFHGFEIIPGASFGAMTISLSLTNFFASRDDVDGLTGFRFTPAISATAPFTLPIEQNGK